MPPRTQAGIALALANLVWATTYPVSQLALSIGAGRLAALRFAIAGIVVLPFIVRAGLPRGRLLWQAAGLGVLNFSVAFGLQLLGISFAGATLAALSIALEPIATALVARLLLKEQLSRLMPIAFPVAAVGTWLLAGAPLPGHDAHLLGILFLLLAIVAYGFSNVLGKPLAHAIGEFRLTGVGTIAAAITLMPWLVFGGTVPHVQPADWLEIAYLGIGPTLLSYSLWFFAVRRAQVSYASLFLYVQPVAGAAMGWLWLGQGLSMLQIGGGALILLGVFLGVRGNQPASGLTA
ncbi:MAG: DMT family transporter [Thermaerobacter sp.]|nr:DMT family transporter [Thermaerobacter sp.]